MQTKIQSKSSEDTFRIGAIIGARADKGDIIALIGDLGAGKTCLTQGIAAGLEVPAAYPITSPTFTLINEYPGRLVLYHFDIYRLEGSKDLEDMGYEDYFYGDGVVVIEWAERIRDILPERVLFVNLTYLNEHERELIVTGNEGKINIIKNLLIKGGF
ncbi:MAG: tRNA (adenosine(37)-N6)-threonylcarbamoyltransferase complex ATPase subunit type 1 TsaE [Syntrophales bacterium]